jgi:fermentation-respiration switch protein FrsA (DUF1100 family)
VHGDNDLYFPVHHGQRLYDAAREPKELWIEPGFGHAESGAGGPLLDRIAHWVNQQPVSQQPVSQQPLSAQAVPGLGVEEMQ